MLATAQHGPGDVRCEAVDDPKILKPTHAIIKLSATCIPAAVLRAAGMMGGPALVRRFLPHLMDLFLRREIDPGRVFDLELPLADVTEGYRAMDERRAIKTLPRL